MEAGSSQSEIASPLTREQGSRRTPKYFPTAAKQEEWPMPVWCMMFCQTLSGSARNWFDSLDPKSVDGFEELSNNFLEEFSQHKRYYKDPTEIHGIKRNPNEGLQAFMDRFKAESAHIKGVPPVLRISAFMHTHGHPELAKKLNDKIPKTVDEMWERVRAFIKGETTIDTTEVIRYPRWEKNVGKASWSEGQNTPNEILVMDNVNLHPPPLMVGTPEKRNMNKFCDYHQDRGHNTNECYHLKKQIEEAVASGRLAYLVKDIRHGGQKSKGSAKGKDKLMNCPVVVEVMIEGFKVRRIHVDSGSSSEVIYEHCFRNLSYRTRSRLRESRIPLVRIATIFTTRETLRECRQIEEAQDLSRHACVTNPTLMQTSSEVANHRVLLAPVEARSRRSGKEPVHLHDMEKKATT
nr:hypothetical protein [Tanacetum cinerariifolium]